MEAQKSYIKEIAMLFPPQGEWTETDFFALPESNRLVELANGELTVMTPSPTGEHALIVMELASRLKNHAEQHTLGLVMTAPLDVRLFPGTIRQPDVLFIRHENKERLGEYVDGPPDWVAEVISPGSRRLDEGAKVREYAQAGVPEYWLLDPDDTSIRVYVLEGNAYILSETATSSDAATLQSATIAGFEVALDEVFGVS